MGKEIKDSRREIDWRLLEGIIELAKKCHPPMREYSTAGQWQNASDLKSDLYAQQTIYV